MDVGIYDVIKGILAGGKGSKLFEKFGKVTFEVHKDSNKCSIRNAVEKIWDVKVKNVRVMNVKGKTKSFGRRLFKTSCRKKAIVTLHEGYKIEFPGQFESMGANVGKKNSEASRGLQSRGLSKGK